MAMLVGIAISAAAQKVGDVAFENLKIRKNGEFMTVTMGIDMNSLDVKNRRSVHIVPVLKNGADSLELSPIGVYSRGRYINYLRNGKSVYEDLGETVFAEKEAPKYIDYSSHVEYQDWMDGAHVYISQKTCGCCHDLKGEENAQLGEFKIPVFEPYLIYITPDPEKDKVRELSGSAFIEFIVSRTDINPEYRNNKHEINKILATIDSVKNDKDIIVKKLWLKGFASPESPYANNECLAKGRTEALKTYVMGLYDFEPETIETAYEPENWEGLKAYVEAGNIPYKAAILDIINLDRDPDTKEWLIKSQYPADYKYLLDNCYPALRRTDYKIEYSIRVFTDPQEILEVFRTEPNKLSLNELYIAATQFEPKSDEYNEVFETAVRMYPDDPVSNLNAANVAISKGLYKDAKRYLLKSGASAEAEYAWGLYYIGVKSYDEAEVKLGNAKELGIKEADDMLKQCAELKAFYSENE